MRKKFLVQGKMDESTLREVLDPILLGIDRTTHKVTYRTSKGVVAYVVMPLGTNLDRYKDAGVSDTLRKIFLWHRDSVEELKELLQSDGVEMIEIVKDGPKTLELKR